MGPQVSWLGGLCVPRNNSLALSKLCSGVETLRGTLSQGGPGCREAAVRGRFLKPPPPSLLRQSPGHRALSLKDSGGALVGPTGVGWGVILLAARDVPGDESHPTARRAGLCPATVTPCGLGGPLRARPPFLCPSWRRVGVPTGGPRGVAVSHRLPAACPLQACRSPLRAGIGAPAQSPSASASLEEVPDVPALKGRRGCPAAALGCAPVVSWRQEPPREPAFWGPEPLERAGGMLAWPAAELISWRVAECGRHARRGGRLLA